MISASCPVKEEPADPSRIVEKKSVVVKHNVLLDKYADEYTFEYRTKDGDKQHIIITVNRSETQGRDTFNKALTIFEKYMRRQGYTLV